MSLSVAQNLSEKIEHSEIISIPHVINKANNITGEIIGIVCPIYFHNMPHIVVDFIKKIKEVKYLFMAFAGAGELGIGLKTTKKLFVAQNIKLSSLFNITMPDNSTKYGVIPDETQKEIFDNADKKIEDIVKIVNGKEEHFDGSNTSLFKTYINPGIDCWFAYRGIKELDKKYTTDEKCDGYSICQKVCQVNNITMKDDKPVWNNHCQLCAACLDWCPKESIQWGNMTVGIKRYHNPNIKVKEIMRSSAEV
jgi:NAD-dependent dihydropyrimidine dehydrogenase PreA subunit